MAELIIAFFLILENELEVVKASLTGSILGNLLLVLGLSFLFGRAEAPRSRATTHRPRGCTPRR